MADLQYIAVIVGAGKGVRMQADMRKQYISLKGIPVLARTVMAFDRHPAVSRIVLVTPAEDLDACQQTILDPHELSTPVLLTAGGKTRQDSVYNGLIKAGQLAGDSETETMVMVHDGVRPFVSDQVLNRLIETATPQCGCIPLVPLTDTIKQISDDGRVEKTLDRSLLHGAQTPQVFGLKPLTAAYELARKRGFAATDDASVMEFAGEPVAQVAGCQENIKLTTPADLKWAAFFLEQN